MNKRLFILLITLCLLTGCDFYGDVRCDKGFNVEGNKCVKIDQQNAIHKKRKACLSGFTINGKCYLTDSTANTSTIVEIDEETGEKRTSCPQGYRLNDSETLCEPVYNAMTEQEYFVCPNGYTFNEDGIKTSDEDEEDGLKNKCYKRIEKEFNKK